MAYSESAGRLRDMIENAIEDQKISRAEMDQILAIASEDGHIDKHEQSLLDLLREMIDHKEVKVIP